MSLDDTTVLHFANARSIRNKSIAVELLLNAIDYDIVSFVETYLTSDDTSAKYLAGCGDVYDLFRCDRTSRAGGGVAVYCKRCLNPVRLAVPDTFSNLEAVCIDLNINHNTRILCIYRPPNCNSLYSDNLCELITYFVSGSDNIVIFGDFNLPDIQWSSYSYPSTRLYQSFMDCIMENALTQHVIVPIRGTNVLDLILSTDPMVVSRVTAGDHFRFLDKVSDHSALICTINLSYVSPTLHQSQSHFDFRRADFVALKVSLSRINWHELLCDCPMIDAMLIKFLDTFFGICMESVPTTKIRKRIARNYPKHITKLFTKCKYLSKHKHLPEGIQKWRAAQIGYMLAIQQYVNNRERTILESGDCAAFYKYSETSL